MKYPTLQSIKKSYQLFNYSTHNNLKNAVCVICRKNKDIFNINLTFFYLYNGIFLNYSFFLLFIEKIIML